MSGNIHYGDKFKVSGHDNIGKISNEAPTDPQAAWLEMTRAVQVLRGQVSAADRQVIDESMNVIGSGDRVEKGTLRRALGNIAGVAAVVGQVGAPVVESVRKVMTAFGV